ncbi:hypothetical protein [Duganella sp.]|uniref:hypothetical protein n=1 Tax=Duganella sp. TaxID=1904440 RepID=UPI0031D89187
MNELRRTIKAHFVHEERGLFSRRQIDFAPSVGDELRFEGEHFFVVTRKVWVFDEPEAQFTRLNIGIRDADTPAAPTAGTQATQSPAPHKGDQSPGADYRVQEGGSVKPWGES